MRPRWRPLAVLVLAQPLALALGLALGLGLAACATSPAAWGPDDVEWRTVEVARPVPATLSAFHEVIQTCEGSGGGPQCAPLRQDGTAVCDAYVTNIFGGRQSALWRIMFQPQGEGTRVQIGLGTHFAAISPWRRSQRDTVFQRLSALVQWQPGQVCP